MNPRLAKVLDILSREGECSVRDLAERFDVSEMTVRRDLAQLEEEGEVVRTHGGAVRSSEGIVEFAFQRKGREMQAEKRAIARSVLELVEPKMAVTLDTGTTTLEAARLLPAKTPLTVLTSSLAIASSLYACENMDLVLLGGRARKGNPDLTGWITEENLTRFRVDLAIIGADAAGPEGAYTTDVEVARVSRAIIAGARRTVLVVDHSKFERTAFVKFADWDDIDVAATDEDAPAAARRWLSKLPCEVIYAASRGLGEAGSGS
jgi:DeoR/GlpR family transcriptional regulator of sugar metabolism